MITWVGINGRIAFQELQMVFIGDLMKPRMASCNTVGQDTLATRFQNFLLTDKYARIWYAAH